MDEGSRGKTILGIIPARGGSKGIPKKNMCLLAGKPLIVYTIEAAQQASTLSKIIVSTDAEDIAEVALNCGVEVVYRPAHLAEDGSMMMPVLEHVLETIKNKFEPSKVVTLQPTSPLRMGRHIDEAVRLLTEDWDSVISISSVEQTPYKMYQLEGDRLYPFVKGTLQGELRQQLPPVYRDCGAVYVTWYDVLLKKKSIWGDNYRSYYIDPEHAIDIDTGFDLKLAEALLTEKK